MTYAAPKLAANNGSPALQGGTMPSVPPEKLLGTAGGRLLSKGMILLCVEGDEGGFQVFEKKAKSRHNSIKKRGVDHEKNYDFFDALGGKCGYGGAGAGGGTAGY
jgi:hypothetical protein